MKVGLFFGSFNPIHIGHLVIAEYIAQTGVVDKVWLVVSPHNPLKAKAGLLDNNHRLVMAKMATEDSKFIEVSDVEFKLPTPSYTITTLLKLNELYPKHQFSLIMGADNLESFTKWRSYQEILNNYTILIYPRPGYTGGELANHKNVNLVDAPLMEISSTYIRNAIKQGQTPRYMLEHSVYKYIDEMNFYKK